MYKPIGAYGIIGNLRSVALVGRDGSVDWKPAPFINSPSVFAAILDDKKGGRWRISPPDAFSSEQAYAKDTNILVTAFRTEEGACDLSDYIPAGAGDARDPEKAEIHRRVLCREGRCRIEMRFDPRFEYAQGETALRRTEAGLDVLYKGRKRGELVSPFPLSLDGGKGASCRFDLREGEEAFFAFHYHDTHPAERTPDHYQEELRETERFWKEWVSRCDFGACPPRFPWHDMVMRSALVLKLLFFEPPGSVAAAATTSLPEEIGGVRNWDYRFTWIRDSAYTVQALLWLGKVKEAETYVRWLFTDCCNLERSRPEDLQILYGLNGEADAQERELGHLEGYRGSRPVRIGNKAAGQRQLDVYGAVFEAVWQMHARNLHIIDSELWETLRAFANYAARVWREPDEGVWEVRGEKRHFTYSKVMCWVALDRAIRLARSHGLAGETEEWSRERAAIRKAVMERGWSGKKRSFTLSFDADDLDTLSLVFPVLGFIDGQDPRMLSTIEAIQRELGIGDSLFYRYRFEDGLPGREGAFLLSSFWMVDALVFAGERERARDLYERLLRLANPLGLYAEEMDPETHEFLGNFPQAYTHIGLINSAFYLSLSEEALRSRAFFAA